MEQWNGTQLITAQISFLGVNLGVSFLMEQWNRTELTIAQIIFHPENLGSFFAGTVEQNKTHISSNLILVCEIRCQFFDGTEQNSQ